MTGHRPFKQLTKGFSEERKARVASRGSELKSEIALHKLRQARAIAARACARTHCRSALRRKSS
jgi:hypothetical protein